MSILPQMAGSPVACPHCGRVFVVPPDPAGPMPPPMPMPAQGTQDPRVISYYGQPQQQRKTSGLAIAALVLGICSFCMGLLGIVAIVLGISARRAIAADPALQGAGMATWGLVLGILGAALNYISMVVFWEEYRKVFGF